MRANWLSGFIVLAMVFCSVAVPPCVCADNGMEDESEMPLDPAGGGWVITLGASNLKQMNQLKSFQPLSRVRLSFRRRDPKTQMWEQEQKYEDLWYSSSGRPVGCRRYFDLADIGGQYGVIRVLPGTAAEQNTRALMNAAVRTLLDVGLRQGNATTVRIPVDLYYQCISDLGTFGFYEANFGSARDVAVMINVASTPAQLSKYMRFKIKDADPSRGDTK